jgi:hypothetical protein
MERLKLALTSRDRGLEWPELVLPSQAVSRRQDGSLIVEVTRPRTPEPARIPVRMNEANREFLAPNVYVQSDQAELRDMAARIIGPETDLLAAALRLRRWVADNMTFDLGIALAPSSEILRDKRGTCVGYATLLAALARAAGIPSRVVIGYVYALGMFGGHAWTEIETGGEWIPLDAALPSSGVADAARLGLAATSFRDGAGSFGSGPANRLFGQIDLRVLEFALAGEPVVAVPEGAPPYRVSDDLYENPGLGLSLRKPAGFTFSELDAVWPDSTLLSIEGPAGTTAVLSEGFPKPWSNSAEFASEAFGAAGIRSKPIAVERLGRPAYLSRSPEKTGLVVFDGPQAWILTAKGIDAGRVLDDLAAGWTLGAHRKR